MARIISVTLLALSVILLVACNSKDTAKTPIIVAPSVRAAPTGIDVNLIRGTCTLRSARTVRLKAQVGGEINSVLVEQGAFVKSGQTLATIDVANLNLKLERLRIDLRKVIHRSELLSFQLSRAEREYAVVTELMGTLPASAPRYGKEMASLMERRSGLRDADLEQETIKLDIKTLDDQIRKSAIRAPFDGVVLTRSAEPGMVVGSAIEGLGGGDILFEVADPSRMIAACIVKEADSLAVKPGAVAKVVIDGSNGEKIVANVTRISPVIQNDAGISRRELQIALPGNIVAKLLPGMNAIVEIESN